jgi:hypothetical protein
MKFLKIFSVFYILILFNGCVQSTALLGPGLTLATTGNIMQAGFQYGANTAIKKETGKDTLEHIKEAVENQSKERKFKDKFTELVKTRYQKTRKKLFKN